ncbi:MAG: sensor histidine kinase N-terminal domain-containing protein [Ramlibacter sp.]|nr:sensor histidine kinase N-terminal domain-containing protein [Ramlibacter sp.]
MRHPSLTRHLLAWSLGALALVWLSFVVAGYGTGKHEADELTDGHLASVAALMLSTRNEHFFTREDPAALADKPELRSHDYQQSISVVIWDSSGRLVTRTGEAPTPAFSDAEGYETLLLGEPTRHWRSFTRWNGPDHERKVMVLLSVHERDELAQDIGEQVVGPGLWLLPAVALVLGLAIRRGLRPLYELSRDVHEIDVQGTTPLRQAHPQVEFRAMVDAINRLSGRYHAALSSERELANEIAHELRTPLASLTLQARALRHGLDGPQAAQALQRLERDALRVGQVLSDLLSLARASRAELDGVAQPLDLGDLAREVLADFAQPALRSGHELALVGPGPFPIVGHPVLLALALRNLLENALAHTPRGTRVEVQLDPQARWLQVCDDAGQGGAGPAVADGPGNAQHARDAQDEAPVTALGLGLGLRVARKVAALHGASLLQVEPPAGFQRCDRLAFASVPA